MKRRKNNFQGTGSRVQGLENRAYAVKGRFLTDIGSILRVLSTRKGFTLLELLTAASITALIGLAILTTFAGGFHVYERIQMFGGPQADAWLALEDMEKNLRNVFPHAAIHFEGDRQSMAFPMITETVEEMDGEEKAVRTLGQVRYEFDARTKTLRKGQTDYAGAFAEGGPAVEETVVSSVEDVAFEYYWFDEENFIYTWKESWAASTLSHPLGVRITWSFLDGKRQIQSTRVVFIPAVHKDEEELEGGEGDEEEGENDVEVEAM